MMNQIHVNCLYRNKLKNLNGVFGLLVVIAVNLFLSSSAFAKRVVQLDLQKVEDSKAIEIEIKNILNGTVQVYKTESDEWSQELDSGIYELRTRSVDGRGVGGVWSEGVSLPVQLDSPLINSNAWSEAVPCANPFQCEFDIAWSAVDKSSSYEVEVYEGGTLFRTEKVSQSNLKLILPSNRTFQFAVKAISEGHPELSAGSQLSKNVHFVGSALLSPKLREPVDDLIPEVQWEVSPGATAYEYEVMAWESETWKLKLTEKKSALTSAPIDPSWPGGRYKIRVRAMAESATSSEFSEQMFFLRMIDRSPPHVEVLRAKQVIEYPTSRYLDMGYDLVYLQYSSDIYENQSHSSFSSIGSSLALGAGYVPNDQWSAGTNFGLGFFKMSGQSFNPVSLDLLAKYRFDLRPKTQLQYGLGFFYDELPAVQGLATNSALIDKVSIAGPRVLLQAVQTISGFWAIHFAVSSDYDLLKIAGPGGALVPTYSSQLDLSAHYWINYRLRTVFGLRKKSQSVLYQSGAQASSSTNRITEDSTGLSLQFNWSF